jgi:hypothetical protein
MKCKECGKEIEHPVGFGLCQKCYAIDLEKRKSAICLGCREYKPIRAKGFCRNCYNRFIRTGTTELVPREKVNAGICSYCKNKPAHAKGLCKTCYARLLRTGSPEEYISKPMKFKFPKKNCTTCGKLFQPLREGQKHCSRKCYDHDRRRKIPIIRVCKNPECGKEFKTTDKRKFFCSNDCKVRYFSAQKPTRQYEIRECEICGELFSTKSYHGKFCSYECQRKSDMFVNGRRKHELEKKYNITEDEYQRMYDSQNGLCLICGKKETASGKTRPKDKLCVDHDHTTGKIRGLLCSHCNSGLGMFKDDPVLLQKAIDYLKNHQQDS